MSTAIRHITHAFAIAAILSAAILATPVDADEAPTDAATRPALPNALSDGILPQLHALLRLPENLQLRYPEAVPSTEHPITYDRILPFKAQEAIDRGYTLPLPFGVAVIGVENTQLQRITDVAVALGKGAPPPPNTPLRPLPFVTLDNVISKTRSKQVKLDAWILPNLNVFASLGKVDGRADLDVVVDLDAAFPPPICNPISPCGTVSQRFRAGVDAVTATLGVTGVVGWKNYFLSGTASFTDTLGKNSDTEVRSLTAGLRFGRRWVVFDDVLFAPYLGVSYLDYDEKISGVTRLNNAFPDGDSLDVRYTAQSTNADKVSAVIGLNVGFENGLSVQGEYNRNSNGDRFVLSATKRF
ncbi:hypothetical protein [Shimia sp. SDUM112013]|uniref:hypothetical protein n=1 Tax=Shimia sp. SDUM112013 TaxID=3136160 RepID=UPI0032EF6A55